jgi:hypothetical protein
VPTLIRDANLNPDLVRSFWPFYTTTLDLAAPTPHQRTRQVVDRSYSNVILGGQAPAIRRKNEAATVTCSSLPQPWTRRRGKQRDGERSLLRTRRLKTHWLAFGLCPPAYCLVRVGRTTQSLPDRGPLVEVSPYLYRGAVSFNPHHAQSDHQKLMKSCRLTLPLRGSLRLSTNCSTVTPRAWFSRALVESIKAASGDRLDQGP